MTISYRTPGAWGAGISRDLHPAEVDQNFYELKSVIDSVLSSMPGTTVSIIDITQTDDDLYVHLSDDSILGPFPMPVMKLVFRDMWLPATPYHTSDIVTNNGSTYLVLAPHTSADTFNPGANDGLGQDYYGRLLSNPSNAMPPDGTVGQVLTKVGVEDFNVGWSSSGVPPAGTIGQVLTKASATDYDTDWLDPGIASGIPSGGSADATLTKTSVTDYAMSWVVRGASATIGGTTYTLILTDFYKWLRCTNGSGCVVTIPTNATAAFAIDTEVTIRAATAGVVSIAAASGVTLNVPTGFIATLLANGATVLIKKVATNTWDLAGLLTPA